MDEQPEAPTPQPDMFSEVESPEPQAGPAAKVRPQGRSARALERLRNRIELVSKELHRLREENASLQREVEELQMRGLGGVDGTPIVFTDNPAALRAKVEGFIESIDAYLDQQPDSSGFRPEA